MASVADAGEAVVGARGLTGRAYRGHVFWDSDVYVLPFLAATHPAAARAMLEYRVRRLPAALRAARAAGRAGARFPWESARSGEDVTPERLRDHRGELVPVLTGELEEHIVADVAWAATCYTDWTGDRAFAAAQGRELIVQTARWWTSRIELDPDGRGHLRGVIGPDEYHVGVDDNAFTNVMARWNLRRAAELGAGRADPPERRRWLELADAIVDGYDPQTGMYEQFAGFHALEPLLIAESAPQRPVAADMLLGHERVSGGPGPQTGRRADAALPRARRGGGRLARAQPGVLRAAHRPRDHAFARRSRGAAGSRPPPRAGARDASPHRPDRPRRHRRQHRGRAFTSRRWAASGAHLRSASPGCDRPATRWRSIRYWRPGGARSSCACGSAGGRRVRTWRGPGGARAVLL